MRILDRKPYAYVLLERDGEWILTFLLGRAVMHDVSVQLTPEEVTALEKGTTTAADLVEQFSTDNSAYEGRQVTPTVWPGKDDERDT